jgi:hypothetical protein
MESLTAPLSNAGESGLEFRLESANCGQAHASGRDGIVVVIDDRSAQGVLRICSTGIKSLNLIDARDARWLYKSHREDPPA